MLAFGTWIPNAFAGRYVPAVTGTDGGTARTTDPPIFARATCGEEPTQQPIAGHTEGAKQPISAVTS